jgi:hypothetical protein
MVVGSFYKEIRIILAGGTRKAYFYGANCDRRNLESLAANVHAADGLNGRFKSTCLRTA